MVLPTKSVFKHEKNMLYETQISMRSLCSWGLRATAQHAYALCLSALTLWIRIPLRRDVLDTPLTALCEKVCQRLAAGRCFSPGTPFSSTNKTDRHDITEILLKVAWSTITLTLKYGIGSFITSLGIPQREYNRKPPISQSKVDPQYDSGNKLQDLPSTVIDWY